jgi:predicted  nucleic acid-binding Zn-ribbon protein
MRYLVLFALPLALAAQPADSGEKLTQALIGEIQQLRLAIERSTLLGARTQLAISQLQMQETAMARASQQVNDARREGATLSGQRSRLADSIREAEQRRSNPEYASGVRKDQIDFEIKAMKAELEQTNAAETIRAAREGEVTAQLQAVQAQIGESRARISEMERALDAAIQQLVKK